MKKEHQASFGSDQALTDWACSSAEGFFLFCFLSVYVSSVNTDTNVSCLSHLRVL